MAGSQTVILFTSRHVSDIYTVTTSYHTSPTAIAHSLLIPQLSCDIQLGKVHLTATPSACVGSMLRINSYKIVVFVVEYMSVSPRESDQSLD